MINVDEIEVSKQLAATKEYAFSYLESFKTCFENVEIKVAERGGQPYIRVHLTDEIGRKRIFQYFYNEIKGQDLMELVTLYKDWEFDKI